MAFPWLAGALIFSAIFGGATTVISANKQKKAIRENTKNQRLSRLKASATEATRLGTESNARAALQRRAGSAGLLLRHRGLFDLGNQKSKSKTLLGN